MLDTDFTTTLLDLQNVLVTNMTKNESNLTIYLETNKSEQICPHCGLPTSLVHDYRFQRIKDMPIWKMNTVLMLKKRRYTCRHCGKHFYENYQFVKRYNHCTMRLYASILDSLNGSASCKAIAKTHFVSDNTVLRCLKLVSFTNKPPLPEVLGIDEFKGNSSFDKYQVQITDIKNKLTCDILLTRQKLYLINYFSKYSREERLKVKYLVMDMWRNYASLKRLFPNAKIIIDRYHYDRQVYWALDNVRKREQKKMRKEKRLLFKHCRFLFFKRYDKLDDEQRLTLENMLNHSPDLYNAWILKERYQQMHDKGKISKEELREWLKMAEENGGAEFKACVQTFKNWFCYIQESFGEPYTNAYTEGKHNLIKVIKRTAYGFRNFDNFRKRILLAA